jgi:hypothetical protein
MTAAEPCVCMRIRPDLVECEKHRRWICRWCRRLQTLSRAHDAPLCDDCAFIQRTGYRLEP